MELLWTFDSADISYKVSSAVQQMKREMTRDV